MYFFYKGENQLFTFLMRKQKSWEVFKEGQPNLGGNYTKGKVQKQVPNVLTTNNICQSMKYYHELLLMTIMSYIKLLTNFLPLFIFTTLWDYQKTRQYSEIIIKSKSLLMFLWGIEKEYLQHFLYVWQT